MSTSPSLNTEAAFENSEAPFDKSKTPFDNSKASFDKSKAPFDSSKAPFENSEAPFDNSEAPFDNSEAPFDKTKAPFDKTKALFDNSEAPFDKSKAPSKITPESLKGSIASSVATGKPVRGLLLPAPALCFLFAIPDHLWVDTAKGAAVRSAVNVLEKLRAAGRAGVPASQPGDAASPAREDPHPPNLTPKEQATHGAGLHREEGKFTA